MFRTEVLGLWSGQKDRRGSSKDFVVVSVAQPSPYTVGAQRTDTTPVRKDCVYGKERHCRLPGGDSDRDRNDTAGPDYIDVGRQVPRGHLGVPTLGLRRRRRVVRDPRGAGRYVYCTKGVTNFSQRRHTPRDPGTRLWRRGGVSKPGTGFWDLWENGPSQ